VEEQQLQHQPQQQGKPRRKKFDLEKQQRLCAIVGLGVSVRAAALLCETSEASVRMRQQRDPAFRTRLAEAKQAREVIPLRAIREASGKNWRAAAWLLERVRPAEYAARKADSWRPSEVSEMIRSFIDYVVQVLDREVANPKTQRRVRERLRNVTRQIDEVSRATPDLLPGPLPKVRNERPKRDAKKGRPGAERKRDEKEARHDG